MIGTFSILHNGSLSNPAVQDLQAEKVSLFRRKHTPLAYRSDSSDSDNKIQIPGAADLLPAPRGVDVPDINDRPTILNIIDKLTTPKSTNVPTPLTVVESSSTPGTTDEGMAPVIIPSVNPFDSVNIPATPETVLYGDDRDNFLAGSQSNDKIFGQLGDDFLVGAGGDDYLFGGGGDDLLQGGLGADILDGGQGTDIASYADADTFIDVDLSNGHKAGAAEGDIFISIEGIEATQHDDIVRGDENNNIIDGLDGNDLLAGRGGNDQIDGGNGTDQINGGHDDDVLAGGMGDDKIYGGDGNDLIRGDLNREDIQGEIFGGNDILYGGKGDDRLGGKTGDDQLYGGDGDDELWGGKGNDWLDGGSGKDILTGLTGKDIFVLHALQEESDIIMDFNQQEQDILHVESYGLFEEETLGELGSDAFVLGAMATDLSDRLIYNQATGLLTLDLDGIGPQKAIELAIFSTQPTLNHSDIFII